MEGKESTGQSCKNTSVYLLLAVFCHDEDTTRHT